MDEQSYIQGNRIAWVKMLEMCLSQLGIDDSLAQSSCWVVEREGAVAALRDLCALYGDNDWPASLFLADVIEKHLERPLRNTHPPEV